MVFSDYKKIVRQDVPLAMHTWLQLGGPAEYFAEPTSPQELSALVQIARNENMAIHPLGFGSNILVSDEGVSGLVVRLTAAAFTEIRSENNLIEVGGGTKLGRVITHSVHSGLGGIESLIGIPGTVGGAIRGNAGTSNEGIGQRVEKVVVLNDVGAIQELGRDELSFGFHSSSLDDTIIVSVQLKLDEDDPFELSKRLQKLWIVRKTSQPMGNQCSGHIFKNPRGILADELIERAGLKGTRIGGAVISERNANFIITEPECSSNDVLRLIELVRTQVSDRLEIEMDLSLEIW